MLRQHVIIYKRIVLLTIVTVMNPTYSDKVTIVINELTAAPVIVFYFQVSKTSARMRALTVFYHEPVYSSNIE